MSLLAATQITAYATAILAGGAIFTSIFAYLAFRTQSQEVALLQQQAKRDIDERRRAQAAKVYLERNTKAPAEVARVDRDHPKPEPHPWLYIAKVTNTSNLPIYEIAIIWLPGQLSPAKSKPGIISLEDLDSGPSRLMPGKEHVFGHEHMLQDPESRPGWLSGRDVLTAILLFRDAAGVRWRTDDEGNLIEERPSIPA